MADPTAVNSQVTDMAFSTDHPVAQPVTTPHSLEDLSLPDETRSQLDLVRGWLKHRDAAEGSLTGVRPGYRSLFHGPAGTGKTSSAAALGGELGVPVYRIDLAALIAKYIGETEKNLEWLFNDARAAGWILLLEEADAIFGRRTKVVDAADRFAGSRESLFQRIERHPGLVILEARDPSGVSEAYAWRLQSEVHFPLPNTEQRRRLWQSSIEDQPFTLGADVDLDQLASEEKLSGGDIHNLVLRACLKALERDSKELNASDFERQATGGKRVGFAS